MVGERWPTDSIRSSSPLILLFFNFVLDIFLRPPKKKKGYELIDLSTCRIDSFLLYNIDRENKKKMSVYSEEPARPDCYSARYFSFFYAAQLYIGQQHAKKLQSNQFWIVYFLAAGRLALCIMILHIPELLVLHIKCACDDKESR